MTPTPRMQRLQRIIRLYRAMPGAEMPGINPQTGNYYWGDVDGTDQWVFCEAIVDAIDAAVAQAKEDRP